MHSGITQTNAIFTFSRQDGLPSNTIYDLYQAKDGFVWVATQNGIARFNGYSFKTYSFANAKSKSVANIAEDEHGRIWFKSFFGDIFYIENDSLKLFEPWNKLHLKGFPTISIHKDTLSIMSRRGLSLYSLKKKDFIKQIKGTQYFDAGGWFAIPNKNKLTIKNSLQSTEKKYTYQSAIQGLMKPRVTSRNWFYGTEQRRLYQVNTDNTLKDVSSNYLDELRSCRDIIELKKNLVAFYGIDGIYIKDLVTQQTTHLLTGENISSIAAIEEGGYMIGTLNKGLIYLPTISSRVLHGQYLNITLNRQDSSLITGDFNGDISIFNRQLDLKRTLPAKFQREVQSLMLDDKNQKLLFYTNRLFTYDMAKDSLWKKTDIQSSKQIISANGRYFFATSSGLQILTNDTTTKYLHGIRCTSLVYDSIHNAVYVGSQLGLHRFSLNTKEQPTLVEISGYSQEFGVSCLSIQGHTLLIGTPSKGLLEVDTRSSTLLHNLTASTGLPSNDITSLKSTSANKFIGTDKGLMIISKDNSFQYLNRTKGLVADEIYDLAIEDNFLWIIHDKGIQKISRQIKKNTHKPLLIFDKITVDGHRTFTEEANATVEINPDQHQLNVQFDIGNNIKSLGHTTIKYRIKELNTKNWNITTLKNPFANYLGLSPGKYVFEAYALNEDGVESEHISFSIQVNAPFYKKAWFIIVVTTLICFIVGFLFYIRNRSNHRKKQTQLLLKSKEQALQLAQLTAIRSQINPHFIFNTMSLIQGKIINGLPDLAEKIIQDFSLLMRKILEFSQLETVSLAAELEVIRRYLSIEKERSQGALQYKVIIDPALDPNLFNIPSLVTQPFVENAIKHGLMHKKGEKKITIHCALVKEELIIRIEDNGIGRKASQILQQKRIKKNKSFAIEAYEKRFQLFNSLRSEKVSFEIEDLYSERGIATGTVVVITIRYDDDENK